jgi:hypothetical protein
MKDGIYCRSRFTLRLKSINPVTVSRAPRDVDCYRLPRRLIGKPQSSICLKALPAMRRAVKGVQLRNLYNVRRSSYIRWRQQFAGGSSSYWRGHDVGQPSAGFC